VKRPILSTLLVFFIALGLAGTQSLSIMTTPSGAAAEEGAGAEEREEQVFKKSPSRRRQIRGKRVQRLFVKPSIFMCSASGPARTVLSLRSFLQSHLPSGNFHFLQVCRI
jgi:hypothetical protein